MRLRLRAWLGRRSTRGLVGLFIGVLALFGLVGGGVYAVLGGVGIVPTGNNIDLQSGLIGWWKLDGNAIDSTPNANNGTPTSVTATTDREGKASGAESFNGSTSTINLGAPSLFTPTNITVSAWFNGTVANTGGNEHGLVCKDVSGSITNAPYCLFVLDGKVEWRITDSTNTTTQIASTLFGTLSDNTWYHVVGTYDGTTMQIFVNGNRIQTSTGVVSGAMGNTTGTLKIGQQKGGFPTRFFAGTIDDVRVYNRVLTAKEVTALYGEYDPGINLSSGENGLVGWWPLNGNTKDATPYGDDGTNTAATLTTDHHGVANSAYSFNGTSSYLDMGAASVLNPTATVSVSAWFEEPSFTSTVGGIVCKDVSSGIGNPPFCIFTTNGFVEWEANNASNTSTQISSGGCFASLTTNTWYNVVGTYSGTQMAIYVNGVLCQTSTGVVTGALANSTGTLKIGQQKVGLSRFFNGSVSDARLYNRVLTVAQIRTIYTSYNSQINLNSSPTNGVTNNLNAGLVAYWPFNGNTRDVTPYSENGTLVGSPSLTTDRKGRANSAYSFNGSTQSITYPTGSLPTSAITVSAWVKQSGLASFYNLINNQWTVNGGWLLYTDGTGIPRFGVYEASAQHNASCATGSFTSGVWHHLVGTYDGSTVKLYLDGNVCTTTASTSGSLAYTTTISVGSTSGGATHSIDDVRIYNRALTASEVSALYNNYY